MSRNNHYNKELKSRARELRNNPTKAERKIWYELLSGRNFGGLKFLRQRVIEDYIVDFFCKELRIVIEIDGKSHDFDDLISYDIERENRLAQLGFHVIRFSDWEVLNDLGGVASMLTEEVKKRSVSIKLNGK